LSKRACQYENTADRYFLVDLYPELDNLWVVGGGFGHGFNPGPMIGEYVADRIMGRPTDAALDQLFTAGIAAKFRFQNRATR
jgi:sarcosine oxidase